MSLEQALQNLPWPNPTPAFPVPMAWTPKVAFEIRQARYIIKTAQTVEEFQEVIKLRTEVFLQEFAGKTQLESFDLEDRDSDADFLIIKDAGTDEVLASYRLLSSQYTRDFYSKTEFCLGSFLDLPDHKLELSRACVRADKRRAGIFVHLLWRGLGEYIARSGCRYLFGCSSIQKLSLPELVQVYRYLQSNDYISHAFKVEPLPEYRIIDGTGIIRLAPGIDETSCEEALPPLLLAYLKAGAKVFGTPAYDQDFACLDLFTVLDFAELSPMHSRKYGSA